MTLQIIQKTASTKTETPITSQLFSKPFAPIIQPPISTPLQQPEQTERPLQTKTNLLPIPLMPPPKKVIQAKVRIGEAGDEYKQIESQFVQRREAKEMQQLENKTGLPENIKTGVENISGIPMDDVRVHYNSNKPSQLRALAYTQYPDIEVAPGQEKHIPV
ncbi:hypothetical protein [Nostoc sp. NMS4]|uniref:hypothetical protein n=1 Tax=Nostoc sp. NMS4 TaxID=2815390 RepID=UPI0025ED956B|nr:hypothetical protein [Nostoc sp. NMS4]MBN3924548.1 hypothetical protein [Nostoc sp. NMS4]